MLSKMMRWLYSLFALVILASPVLGAEEAPAGEAIAPESPAIEALADDVQASAALVAEDADATTDEIPVISAVSPEEAPVNATKETAEEEKPAPTWVHPPVPVPEDGIANIFVIPVKEAIGKTNKYILRRGLKDAIDSGAEVVVLELDTPGGRGDIMLEMMEMVDRYEGRTIAFVNKEAMSAGALISASADEIYMAPKSVIGAAAVINSTGEDIPHTLKTKIDSYMDAKLRAITTDNPRRADVLRAMMQEDYVLAVDGKTIKDKGALLSLTSEEAMKLYGEPATPLLGSGIYNSVEALADAEYGAGHYQIKRFETSWSETASMFMEKAAPVLMGLGILALVVEFYTPGFGLPGITGLALLAIVFLSNYMAGLAGNEPLIFFALGFLLLMIELLILPGVLFLATTGILLMLGALVWSLADIWPKSGGGIEVDFSSVAGAIVQVMLGIVIAAVFFALIYRFLPKSWFARRLVLQNASGGGAPMPSNAPLAEPEGLPAPGSKGHAATNMRPSGTVEIKGVVYEATLSVGAAERGEHIVVTGHKGNSLLVKKAHS